MATVSQTVTAPIDRVWNVLSDGWLYPLWVVGAARIRDVDPSWPKVGSRIHHSVGLWPVLIDDNTEVLEVEPGTVIRLRARAWILGEANVRITLAESGGGTEVSLAEEPVSGPGKWIPAPLLAGGLTQRNIETLRRLAYIAESRPYEYLGGN